MRRENKKEIDRRLLTIVYFSKHLNFKLINILYSEGILVISTPILPLFRGQLC